jgi:predicted ABC-type ATPase
MPQAKTDTFHRALIIAGPNGAGKTTFAGEFLPTEGKCTILIDEGGEAF